MVKHIQFRETKAGLPPLDESWWEAVMAEDEAKNTTAPVRKLASPNPRANNSRSTADLPSIDWSKALEIYESDQLVTLLVTSYNRGGLLVNGDGLQGFVPVSHLIDAPTASVEVED
jgi:small subunit ribosomal protein S1